MVQPGRFNFGLRRVVGRLLAQLGCFALLTSLAVSAELTAPTARAQQVAEHITAGEFGPAMTKALAAAPTERGELLKQVAEAQQASGDNEAAAGTIRRLPRGEQRAQMRAEQSSLAGGSQQGFMQLMRLIQQSTPGKWEDQEGEGGRMSPFPTGVRVAPNGLLHRLTTQEHANQLTEMGIRARQADLNEDLAKQSQLRMVSLTRLERAVARRIEEGMPVPESMAQLAGLYQVKYVLVNPDSNEIVLAGPANGWQYNNQGQAISNNDGHPTLHLDDFVTVLRTFARGDADFGCSINTRDEGVKALKEFVEKSAAKGGISEAATAGWVNKLQHKLGRQDVVVWGVPSDSRVARVIVEADYRLKLIGIDRLKAGKEIPSYFDLLPPSQQNGQQMDALRWWLTMKFDTVLHSADKTVFEIQGSSVLCQSENQVLTAEGKHVPTGQSEATNRQFAENFTKHYGKLAAKDLVFADTQNVFDLALCSALIKNEDLVGKANWNMGVFAPNGAYTTASYPVPKEIESVVNHRVYKGHNVVVQVAGGVSSGVMTAAKDPNMNKTAPELQNVGNVAKAPQLPAGRWWWDAAN